MIKRCQLCLCFFKARFIEVITNRQVTPKICVRVQNPTDICIYPGGQKVPVLSKSMLVHAVHSFLEWGRLIQGGV